MIKKVVLLLCVVSFLSGCSDNNTTSTKNSKENRIHEVSYDQLQEKLQSNDRFVLYIGRSDCGDCIEFDPILKSYIEENEKASVYYINVKEFRDAAMSEEATEEEILFFESIKEELSYSWTPTLHLYEDNKIISTYTYLDLEFYNIENKKEQEKVKKEFVDAFKQWMDEIFE